MKKRKRYIPSTHCIRIFMWRNTNPSFSPSLWEDYEAGDSSMTTGAGSLTAAMKIVKNGFNNGYTHFKLTYPVAMYGGTENEPSK